MSMQGYNTVASRNLIRAAQGMLEHAQPITVLGDFGTQREMPQNSTDTLVFRRTLPFGASTSGLSGYSGASNQELNGRYTGTPSVTASSFVLQEGTTPNANTISFQDISVQLQQYGMLYKFSNRVEQLYEDDIPGEMVKLIGETLAEVLELVRYGTMKAGSVVAYANGSARTSVNTPISLNVLRRAARTLESNRARRVTSRLAPGVNFNTRAVQPAYLVFMHTDCESDVRNLPGFTRVEEYGSFKPIHDREVGACEQFRFLSSPVLAPILAGGASLGSSGMMSQGGSSVDIYPYIVIGEDAWGQVALKGQSAIKPTILKASDKNHANPMGMFGYVGASTWFATVRLNEAWMVRCECAVTAL